MSSGRVQSVKCQVVGYRMSSIQLYRILMMPNLAEFLEIKDSLYEQGFCLKGKQELLSLVEQVNYTKHCNCVVQVKHTIFWLNRSLRVYFFFFVPNFPKSTYRYFFHQAVRSLSLF